MQTLSKPGPAGKLCLEELSSPGSRRAADQGATPSWGSAYSYGLGESRLSLCPMCLEGDLIHQRIHPLVSLQLNVW